MTRPIGTEGVFDLSSDGEIAAGVKAGDVLAGKFRIDKILGVGGMGVVVAAHHIHLDEKVALKFLLPGMLQNKEAVARFAREARAAVKIRSEHVARVSDVGTLENGAPYMVMEYLDGGDLSGWLEKRGALPVEQAVEFILQASEAIAEAHTIGIVHRDLKPANLFVIRRPDSTFSVKVLDFGISKVTQFGGSAPDQAMTKTSSFLGSPLYMSPEQMQSSKEVDTRSDIWAMGIILHELLSGASPFSAETMPELVLKIMSAPPPPVRQFRPEVPEGLQAVLLKCLERDRGRRFQTIGELAVALMPYAPARSRASVDRITGIMQAAGLSTSAIGIEAPAEKKEEAVAAGTAASWGTTASQAPAGRKTIGISIGVGLALALAAGGFVLGKTRSDPNEGSGAVPSVQAGAAIPTTQVATSAAEPVAAPMNAGAAPSLAPAPSAEVAPALSAASGPAEPKVVKAGAAAPVVKRTARAPAPAAHPAAPTVASKTTPAAPAPAAPAPAAPAAEPKKTNVFNDRK